MPERFGAHHEMLYALDKDQTLVMPVGLPEELAVLAGTIAELKGRLQEREQRLDALSEVHRLHVAMVETCTTPVMVINSHEQVLAWNRAASLSYGYSAEEMQGTSILRVVPTHKHEECRRLIQDVVDGRHVHAYETTRVRRDGTLIEVSLNFIPVCDDAGRIVAIANAETDLSDRRLAEARFSAVVEACGNGMIMVDAEGVIVTVNGEAERQFACPRAELIGKSFAQLLTRELRPAFDSLHPTSLEQKTMCTLQTALGDAYCLRADGTQFPAEIRLSSIPIMGRGHTLAEIVDIADRRASELSSQVHEANLTRSNRELQEFVYAASHDLQEPLRMVVAYTELLARKYQDALDEKARKYIFYASDGAQRMQVLVRDLLEYSRVETKGRPPTPTDASRMLATVLRSMSKSVADAGARVEAEPLPMVMVDPAQLQQVMQNLISNAIKFHGSEPPVVRVSCSVKDSDCTFAVVDNGIGIRPEFSEKVFQMFQRLHDRSKYGGSGIGLALVQRIVERHGGRVWFESEPGLGTTFYFTLPSVK